MQLVHVDNQQDMCRNSSFLDVIDEEAAYAPDNAHCQKCLTGKSSVLKTTDILKNLLWMMSNR